MLSVTPPVHSLSMLSVTGGRQKPPTPGPRELLSNSLLQISAMDLDGAEVVA